jgi:hypothetical protein
MSKSSSVPTLTLTNEHLCSHTDGGKSTYVFHTSQTIEVPATMKLESDAKSLERGADGVQLDRH